MSILGRIQACPTRLLAKRRLLRNTDTKVGKKAFLKAARWRWCVYSTVQAGRPENMFFFWPTFVTRLLTPRSRKSSYGLLLGCKSGFDRGPFEKNFFDKVRTQKPGNSSLSVLAHDRNRSGVVELVGREPWIIARVENGVTKFSPPQRQKTTPKLSKQNWIRKTVFSGKFSFFWPREN